MKTEPNFVKGTRYFYVHAATLACSHIAPQFMGKVLPLYGGRPKTKGKFHRVELTVIRTKREASAMDRRFTKARARIRAMLKKEGATDGR